METSQNTLIKPLHGLRGLAALTVVVGHTGPAPFNASQGVVLFFALSGYLLAKLYLDKSFSWTDLRSYAVARFARVYPLFAVVILGTVALNAATGLHIFRIDSSNALEHLFLAGSGMTVWTISVEFQFYAVFVAIWGLHARGWLGNRAFLALLAASAGLAFFLPMTGRIDLGRYLFIFLAGAGLARIAIPQSWAQLGLPFFATLYLVIGMNDTKDLIYTDPLAIFVCMGLLASAIHAPDSPVGRFLGARVPFWLGEISFGIYLLHRHAEWIATALVKDPSLRLGLIIIISVLAAHLANVFIETGARSKLRQWFDTPPKTKADALAAS